MYQKQHLLVCIILSFILTLLMLLFFGEITIKLHQIVKLQNKAVRVINDVPSIESITPHYTSLTGPSESSLLYLAFKGHNISLSRPALFFSSNMQFNSI